ncbi:MAG: glycosyltransferase [Anaerobacillus sp.]|uniref:glycosyltransferase n=1 Tax=Anaerobacillus sp. TaxID=1872506 RepID=UPI0039198600
MASRITEDLTGISLAFLTPYYHQGRGNATTARRIVDGLGQMNIKANVVAYDEQTFSQLINKIEQSDFLHVLHFRRFAEWLEANNYHIQKPYIITSGGTDVNIDIFKSEYKEKIGYVLNKAAAITVFSEDAKQKLADEYSMTDKVHIIEQSVWFPDEASDENSTLPLTVDDVGPNILLPAGLRAVKDVLFVLPALVELKRQLSGLTFTILGAPLEGSVVEAVREVEKSYPWINYLEEVPLRVMKDIYRQSDLVINTSISEGQSSALLEAMFLEKPVIARNNGGNRSVITHGENGLLFDHPNEFYEQVVSLFSNDHLRKKMSINGQKYVFDKHSLKDEMARYLSLYKQLVK